jgi:hypothetical protein
LVTLTQAAVEVDSARTLKLWLVGVAIVFF